VAVGKKVAAEILAWRQNDGFAAANPQPPAFLPSTLPGIWRPTATGPAQFSRLGDVEPFGLLTPTQFLPIPQPQLESAEYAEAFNEVKNKGRATASTRTPEETRFAQLFAGAPGPFFNATGAFRLWGNVARDVSQMRNYSLSRTARLYALLSASINDSLQTSQTSKFIYRLWRPETAIDQAHGLYRCRRSAHARKRIRRRHSGVYCNVVHGDDSARGSSRSAVYELLGSCQG
jgi:hypothetical protein